MRIIGLDPSLKKTGWGVLDFNNNILRYVDSGTIETSSILDLSFRLNYIFTKLSEVLNTYKPDNACLEEIFFNANAVSTIKLSMARGVIMLAPANFGISTTEYSANKVKKAITGSGHAHKDQVKSMIYRFLPKLKANICNDESDALAVAICHANHYQYKKFA